MVKRAIALIIVLLLGWSIDSHAPALAENTSNGSQLFSVHCAGCHPQGGNIIRRGKTLKKRALEKYEVNSLEAVMSLVANGKNNMSAFSDRLSPQEIENVATYVLDRAENNWRS